MHFLLLRQINFNNLGIHFPKFGCSPLFTSFGAIFSRRNDRVGSLRNTKFFIFVSVYVRLKWDWIFAHRYFRGQSICIILDIGTLETRVWYTSECVNDWWSFFFRIEIADLRQLVFNPLWFVKRSWIIRVKDYSLNPFFPVVPYLKLIQFMFAHLLYFLGFILHRKFENTHRSF